MENNEECVVYKDEVPDTKKNSTLGTATHVQSPATPHTTSNTTTTPTPTNATAVASKPTAPTTTTTTMTTTHTTDISNGGSAASARNHNKDGIVIKLDSCKTLSGDIKIEFYTKHMISRRKTLFTFWFNTYFISEKQHDGKCLWLNKNTNFKKFGSG